MPFLKFSYIEALCQVLLMDFVPLAKENLSP